MTAGALGYLTRRSMANRMARQAAQLRSPRYVAALLLGVAYLWYVLVHQQPGRVPGGVPRAWVVLAGALGLVGLVTWSWIVGSGRRALAFSPAEVTLLFPAPLTRRTLVHYKLLRSQLVILFNTVLWTLLLGWSNDRLAPPFRALAIWTLLSTLSLHRLGAAFVRAGLKEHGPARLGRRAVPLLVALLAAAVLLGSVMAALPELRDAAGRGVVQLISAFVAALSRPLPAFILWPFKALVRPLVAVHAAGWARTMPAALVVLAVHYVWVVRADAEFEEAAAEASLARARRRAERRVLGVPAVGSGGLVSPPLVALAPTGWPAAALLWKNVTAVVRRRRARNIAALFVVVGTLAAAGSARGRGSLSEVAATLAVTWCAFLFFLGPHWVRNDLRADLTRFDVLRALPLRGPAIVAAEALASSLTLTVMELGLLGLGYLGLLANHEFDVPLDERTFILMAAVLLLPPINFAAMLLQNGAALVFPAWVRLGADARGVEALGQGVLATVAYTAVLVLLLLPAVGMGVALARALQPAFGPWALAPGAAAGFAVFALELLSLVRWLGRMFERTDPAEVGLEAARE
ncbi:MAG TPA: putative ABC exporter domain-containing protein [Gemmatimonadales bacterium]|nr:putative ABC exporter domain-containing protein [Gemmatimonadales bacterium]